MKSKNRSMSHNACCVNFTSKPEIVSPRLFGVFKSLVLLSFEVHRLYLKGEISFDCESYFLYSFRSFKFMAFFNQDDILCLDHYKRVSSGLVRILDIWRCSFDSSTGTLEFLRRS